MCNMKEVAHIEKPTQNYHLALLISPEDVSVL